MVFFRKRLQTGSKDPLVFSEFRQLDLIQPFVTILASFRAMNEVTRPIIEEVSWAFINFTVSQEFEINCLEQYGFKALLFLILEETEDCVLLENVASRSPGALLPVEHRGRDEGPKRRADQGRSVQQARVCSGQAKRALVRLRAHGDIHLVHREPRVSPQKRLSRAATGSLQVTRSSR